MEEKKAPEEEVKEIFEEAQNKVGYTNPYFSIVLPEYMGPDITLKNHHIE